MSALSEFASLLTAGALMVSAAVNTAAPQHDINGTLFLCNRDYRITEAYIPETVDSHVYGSVRSLRPDAASALKEMFDACKQETGVSLQSVSGYRSYRTQEHIWRRKLRSVKGKKEKAQEYVAPPGSSEHQLGLAMDIGQRSGSSLNASFARTKGGKWLAANAWRFGFILRYDRQWEAVTGYRYEPWHFRYVGKTYAKEIFDSGLPLETWLVMHRTELLTGLFTDERKSQK